jgi:hypothetical protein
MNRTHSQAATYDNGRIIVEPRRGRWCIYIVGERGTRALWATYTARYKALSEAAALAGHDDDYETL